MIFYFMPNACKSGCTSTEQDIHRINAFTASASVQSLVFYLTVWGVEPVVTHQTSLVSEEQHDVPNAAVSMRHCLTEKLPPVCKWGLCFVGAGSMRGPRETVAKALALECMRAAKAQERGCFVFAFAGPQEVSTAFLMFTV